jgi:hypothetical protein
MQDEIDEFRCKAALPLIRLPLKIGGGSIPFGAAVRIGFHRMESSGSVPGVRMSGTRLKLLEVPFSVVIRLPGQPISFCGAVESALHGIVPRQPKNKSDRGQYKIVYSYEHDQGNGPADWESGIRRQQISPSKNLRVKQARGRYQDGQRPEGDGASVHTGFTPGHDSQNTEKRKPQQSKYNQLASRRMAIHMNHEAKILNSISLLRIVSGNDRPDASPPRAVLL